MRAVPALSPWRFVDATGLVVAVVTDIGEAAALASGWRYDRFGAKTLVALPVLSILVALTAFGRSVALVIAGALLWGAAVGIQESALRAVVADLVMAPVKAGKPLVWRRG
ncbi:MAG: hypothetical protein EKK34_03485 [Mycobacterium sp.]|nr:MAG: hypothetical protein EKK34_03485 [Mycobacterium sp.]